MRVVLLICLLSTLAPAQEEFSDQAYKFSFTVPAGLHRLTAEERAAITGMPLEQAQNKAREGSQTKRLEHHHVWLEPPGNSLYGREIDLRLVDYIPFQGPDDFREFLRNQGMEILREEKIGYPLGPALLLDCAANGPPPENQPIRMYVLFIARLQRWATLYLRSNAGDFPIVEPGFRELIQTIQFNQPVAPKPPSAFDAPALAGEHSAWASLEVAGSLVLAAALILAMVLGGKKTA